VAIINTFGILDNSQLLSTDASSTGALKHDSFCAGGRMEIRIGVYDEERLSLKVAASWFPQHAGILDCSGFLFPMQRWCEQEVALVSALTRS
jgi:hypothetical protein